MASILKVDTIQDQAGNNIINENANVITIGASGDTITVPAGATVSGFTSAGIDDNATSVAITIDSSEKVGIGSTDPSNDAWSGANSLVIKDTSGDNGITIISSSTTNNGNIAFADSSGGSFSDIGGLITYLHNGDSMRFMTANAERMRLNSTGLGIGTSSPTLPLEVSGSALIGGSIIATGSTTTTNSRRAIMTHDGSSMIFKASGDSTNRNIVFERSGDGSADETMRITSGALVGIGTASPSEKLHVVGDILATGGDFKSDANNYLGFSNDTFARFVINDSEKMRITSAGNVLVGSTVNDSTDSNGQTIKGLVLSGNNGNGTYTYIRLLNRVENATTSNGISIAFDHAVSASTKIPLSRITASPESSTAGNLKFFTSSSSSLSEAMRITSSGNVGIGTTSPLGKVHIETASSGASSVSSSHDELIVEGSGNAGISILAGGSNLSGIAFGDSADPDNGRINYLHSDTSMRFICNAQEFLKIDSSGDLLPGSNDAQDLGSSSLVWRNIYTGDLHLSNEAKEQGNAVDGTKGNWTIQEGAEDLYILNNKTGKKFKFKLEEIS